MLSARILGITSVPACFCNVGRVQLKWERREIVVTAGTTASKVLADFAFTDAGRRRLTAGV